MTNYKFLNKFRTEVVLKKSDPDVKRYELSPGSSIYVHERDGRHHYAATGDDAIEFCTEAFDPTGKVNGHGHKVWYRYSVRCSHQAKVEYDLGEFL